MKGKSTVFSDVTPRGWKHFSLNPMNLNSKQQVYKGNISLISSTSLVGVSNFTYDTRRVPVSSTFSL
uniref:Uncharacterized protein n=1 Tax=Octopus bimaculoides TaxID=37653 RepID=A0A0L8FR37_OCTBM